jgi:DNA-binding transcriptional LysR family regulator
MDKLGAMRAFVRVVEAGNFTRAADVLGLPKASVTRHVQSLEQELRTLLLNRTTRRVSVTADGHAYYERAARLLDEMEDLEASLAQARAHPRGRLRIDVPGPVAHHILLPALEDFRVRYPDIRIEMGVGDRPVDLLAESVDCVIRSGPLADQSLVARRIGEIQRVVCASPGYLKQHGAPLHPSELQDEGHRVLTYFGYSNERVTYVMQRGDERHEVRPRPGFSFNDADAMLGAALGGLGIARTAAFMAAPHLAAGTLRLVLPEWSVASTPLFIAYLPNRHVSSKLRVFIEWAAERVGRALATPAARTPETLPAAARLRA